MLGCLRCILLDEAAHLFRSEWANTVEGENGSVELIVEKGFVYLNASFYTVEVAVQQHLTRKFRDIIRTNHY